MNTQYTNHKNNHGSDKNATADASSWFYIHHTSAPQHNLMANHAFFPGHGPCGTWTLGFNSQRNPCIGRIGRTNSERISDIPLGKFWNTHRILVCLRSLEALSLEGRESDFICRPHFLKFSLQIYPGFLEHRNHSNQNNSKSNDNNGHLTLIFFSCKQNILGRMSRNSLVWRSCVPLNDFYDKE